MVKRLCVAVLTVAAVLLVAAPAMAFNGFRSTYVLTDYCSTCHFDGGVAKTAIYDDWVHTGHARAQTNPISRGPGCASCHVSNYDPAKHVPTAPGTNTFPTTVAGTQGSGMSAFSENFVGCSSCHVGVSSGPNATINDIFGTDPANTGHAAPYTNMANADICGQCHARYSATVDTYNGWRWPTTAPSPEPTMVRLQGTLGDFNPLGTTPDWAPAPIRDFLNVASPSDPQGNAFWAGGQSAKAHGQGAVQYSEWDLGGHKDALQTLKAASANPPDRCLKCHSGDYRMAVESGRTPPTAAQAKFGVTCVSCHTAHEEGPETAVWNHEKNPQLPTTREELCVQCHTAELPVNAEATPGARPHFPVKEMIAGYGAIGVAKNPSVHNEASCVQCHMVPTGYEHTGNAGTAGNHVFAIISPREAASQTVATSQGAKAMPYSSCTECHGRSSDPLATYLQSTIDRRQGWVVDRIADIHAALDAAAVRMGYADEAAARTAINAIPATDRTSNQVTFLTAYTNVAFVERDGSKGLHNWPYAQATLGKAIVQAESVEAQVIALQPWKISIKASRANMRRGQNVTISGTVKTASDAPGVGQVLIQKRWAGQSWSTWRTVTLSSFGGYARNARVNRTGTIYWRAIMPADDLNLRAVSKTISIRVRN